MFILADNLPDVMEIEFPNCGPYADDFHCDETDHGDDCDEYCDEFLYIGDCARAKNATGNCDVVADYIASNFGIEFDFVIIDADETSELNYHVALREVDTGLVWDFTIRQLNAHLAFPWCGTLDTWQDVCLANGMAGMAYVGTSLNDCQIQLEQEK